MTANEYLDAIQDFLEQRFGEEAVADFFVNEHPRGGVGANVIIKADFDTDFVKQINVILVPDIEVDESGMDTAQDAFERARSVF